MAAASRPTGTPPTLKQVRTMVVVGFIVQRFRRRELASDRGNKLEPQFSSLHLPESAKRLPDPGP
eukprot:scaffold21598_cov107-Isochrysis_galbana.AAC.1